MSSMLSLPAQRADDQPAARVLLVSPNERLRAELREKVGAPRWTLVEATSGADALEQLESLESEVLLLDPMLPDIVPNEFSALVLKRFPRVEILTLDTQSGHLLVGNTSPTPLADGLKRLIYEEGPAASAQFTPSARRWPAPPSDDGEEVRAGLMGMVGRSKPMQHLYRLTEMVARTETTVLVTGESGTGKDLVAQAIHMISPRAKHPFAVVNCAAIPEALLEAELFGYAKGAFTGATQSRIGRIHAAHGGTLFLDEIGDMPLSLQGKILRFLEQGEVQRLGGNDNLKVDVRVIAATNADLKGMAAQKTFREDLYYRLAVFPIQLPPLREREGDVGMLAEAFAGKFCPGARISAEVHAMLAAHPWPGNVRELRNVVERAGVLMGGEPVMSAKHILM